LRRTGFVGIRNAGNRLPYTGLNLYNFYTEFEAKDEFESRKRKAAKYKKNQLRDIN